MAKQLERGTQWPMRPTAMILEVNGTPTLIDQSGGVDWTAAGSRISVNDTVIVMDDFGRFDSSLPDVTVDMPRCIAEI